MIISYITNISYETVWAIPYHKHPCKNKLDDSPLNLQFYVASRGCVRTILTYAKTTTLIIQVAY